MGSPVLLVEDDDDIAAPLVHALEHEGYAVRWVQTGGEALALVSTAVADGATPELMLLDLGLPDMDGLEVCRQARAGGYAGAILILTARAGEVDLVVGLDQGADDYLAKPFGLAELQARVRALLRRARPSPGVAPDRTTSGEDAAVAPDGLHVDIDARRVFAGDTEVSLTGKEFDVLAVLTAHQGKVVARDHLMAQVWDANWFGSTKTLDVTIGRLRQKLEPVGQARRIVAVRGVGFRLEEVDGRHHTGM